MEKIFIELILVGIMSFSLIGKVAAEYEINERLPVTSGYSECTGKYTEGCAQMSDKTDCSKQAKPWYDTLEACQEAVTAYNREHVCDGYPSECCYYEKDSQYGCTKMVFNDSEVCGIYKAKPTSFPNAYGSLADCQAGKHTTDSSSSVSTGVSGSNGAVDKEDAEESTKDVTAKDIFEKASW